MEILCHRKWHISIGKDLITIKCKEEGKKKHKSLIAAVLIVLGIFVFTAIPSMLFAKTGKGKNFANPSWNQTLDSNKRFIVLTNMNQEAVLDMETGLVWEQSPSTDNYSWYIAKSHCRVVTTGNRKGWRVPTIEELSSLVDPSQENPALPVGHPFSVLMSETDYYWSASTYASAALTDGSSALAIRFDAGGTFFGTKSLANWHCWCVRGGDGYDTY